MSIKPGGFTEAGLSTADMNGWVNFLTTVAGYEEIWRGESPPSIKPLWGMDSDCTVRECLLGCPGHSTGYIRLFQFENTEQVEIRHEMQPWDGGGIYDLDIRVGSLLSFVDKLESRGWKAFTRPADWQFGPRQVREWLVRGPESVVLALIERLSPRMEEIDALPGFSHIFNSTQIVADMEGATDFYRKLGFIEFVDLNEPLPGRGGELLGLSPEEAPVTPVGLKILHPEGVMEGSVELVTIGGKEGRDASARALPHNLGLNLLRFPVADLRGYVGQLVYVGLLPTGTQPINTRIEPFGQTEIVALQSPEGAWLEFYQEFS